LRSCYLCQSATSGAHALNSEIWKDNPDIEFHMISYLGQPILWPNGEVFGTLCVLDDKENYYGSDFSELFLHLKENIEDDLKLLINAQQMREKNVELKRLNDTKTQLLSLISHDVRGSVATADEVLKIMLDNFDNFETSDLKESIGSLSQNISSVNLVLEELLVWAKNDLVELEAEFAEVNLIDVIVGILQLFYQSAKVKNISLTTDFCSDSVLVNADRKMLTIGLRNIISNAVKYTEKGGEVLIRVLSLGEKYTVEVIDNGLGMSKQNIENLFTYNSEHRKSGTGGESCAGIGLIITKEFLDKSKAKLGVESELGKGSRFVVTI
jgi:signal transduction histidine kinase